MDHQFEPADRTADKEELGEIINQLMLAYGQDVWNFALLLTKRRDLADDISQEVFMLAFQNYADFRHQASVKTWLLRITRNRAINQMRSAFFRKVTLMEAFSPRGSYPSTEKEVMDRFAANQIWEIVLQLPRIYREVIVLEAFYQLSDKEMAALLGISLGALKSRLHRARLKVERAMEATKDG